jgi:hypothetical protein
MKKNEPKIDPRANAELWKHFCDARKLAEKAYIRLGRAVRIQKDRETQAEQAEMAMRAALYKYFKAHGLAAGDITGLSRLALDLSLAN